jgi:flagellar biosynthesis regulator FlbT
MSQAPGNPGNPKTPGTGSGDGWLTVQFLTLYLVGLLVLVGGALDVRDHKSPVLLGLGVVAIMIPLVGFPIARSLARSESNASASPSALDPQVVELLQSIHERLLISDNAKRIIHREQDLIALRRAIREDIDRKAYDAAVVLTQQLAQNYGYLEEAEQFRQEINTLRAAALDQKISNDITRIDSLLELHDWEKAAYEAARVQRTHPDSPRVAGLARRVREAREGFKQDLERQFLEASAREEIERAMELLKQLDKYLTPEEAAPFLEMARGVIGKKRENLGVQFKLAVQDKEWTVSVAVGEQIIREFPNSKMANEVRGMLDLLRERAFKEQAARPQQTV